MQTLLQRLNLLRPDIKSFLLSVHELSSEDDPVRTAFQNFSCSSPDAPAQASAILYPQADEEGSPCFDPITYIILTGDHISQMEQEHNFSLNGPMPSYFSGGKEVTRRFECTIAFIDGVDTLPPEAGGDAVEEPPGCC